MLSKPKYGWSLVPRMYYKLLKDIPHFVSFFQIVVLISSCIHEHKIFKEKSERDYISMCNHYLIHINCL